MREYLPYIAHNVRNKTLTLPRLVCTSALVIYAVPLLSTAWTVITAL